MRAHALPRRSLWKANHYSLTHEGRYRAARAAKNAKSYQWTQISWSRRPPRQSVRSPSLELKLLFLFNVSTGAPCVYSLFSLNVFLQCLVLFVLRFRIRQGLIWMDHYESNNINSCPEEVAWVAALAEKHKFIKGIVGGLDLTQVIVIWGMARTPDIKRTKWSNSNKKNGNICFRGPNIHLYI